MGDGPLQRFFVAILLRCHEYTRLSIINKEHEWNHFDKKFCYLILLAIFVCSRFMESFGLEIFLSPEKRRMILEEGDNCWEESSPQSQLLLDPLRDWGQTSKRRSRLSVSHFGSKCWKIGLIVDGEVHVRRDPWHHHQWREPGGRDQENDPYPLQPHGCGGSPVKFLIRNLLSYSSIAVRSVLS